jgi:hypothetical protein
MYQVWVYNTSINIILKNMTPENVPNAVPIDTDTEKTATIKIPTAPTAMPVFGDVPEDLETSEQTLAGVRVPIDPAPKFDEHLSA